MFRSSVSKFYAREQKDLDHITLISIVNSFQDLIDREFCIMKDYCSKEKCEGSCAVIRLKEASHKVLFRNVLQF